MPSPNTPRKNADKTMPQLETEQTDQAGQALWRKGIRPASHGNQCDCLTRAGQRCRNAGTHYLTDLMTLLCRQHWQRLTLQGSLSLRPLPWRSAPRQNEDQTKPTVPSSHQCDCLTPNGQRCPKPGAYLMRDGLTLLCKQHWERLVRKGIAPPLRLLPWR